MKNEPINLQYTTIKDPLPDFIFKGLKKYSSGANSYKPQPQELVVKLAKRHSVPKEMIYLTAGCDEAIQMFILTYGERTYSFTPTYIVYKDALVFGKKFTEIYSIKQNKYDISSNRIDNATLIFLANPNNPSGFSSKDKVLESVKNNKNSMVVIDEAYGDFAELSVIKEVKNNKNMAVLKSFSKGFGMAGNRLGYIIAHPEIISKVKDKTQWSNVSYLSVGAAVTALDNEKYFKAMRDAITKRRQDFVSFLSEHKFKFLPSKINAVVLTFKNKKEGRRFFDFLAENNIIASHGNGASNIGLDESFVRIAVGNAEQMKETKKVLKRWSVGSL